MTFNLARAIGPASAALAVQYLGIPAAFGAERVLVPDLHRRAALHRPAGAAAGRAQRQPPRREHRHPAPPAAAGRLPADRGRGRLRLRPGEHARAGLGARLRPGRTRWPATSSASSARARSTAGLVVAGRVGGSRRRMFTTLLMLGLGMIAFSRHALAAARAAVPLRRGLRLPRLEHARDLDGCSSASSRGSAAGSWRSGASRSSALRPFASIIDGVIAERVRRPLRGRAAGAAGAGVRGLDRAACANARLGRRARQSCRPSA